MAVGTVVTMNVLMKMEFETMIVLMKMRGE